MKKLITISIIVLTASFLSGCSKEKTSNKELVKTAPVAVKVSKMSEQNNLSYISASGKIQSVNTANLSTRYMGFVNKVSVKVGDKVTKGQILVSIQSNELQAKRAQAEAGVNQAQAAFNNVEVNYKRFEKLYAQQSVTQKEFDDIAMQYKMAKAQLEVTKQMANEVKAQFAYANIVAPFSGVITGKMVEEGDLANPGMPLISVETPGNFEVVATIPESQILRIDKDKPVNIQVKALNKEFTGKVSEVSTSAVNTGGQYLVTVSLDKTEASILSGMYVTALFAPLEAKTKETSLLLLPKQALVSYGDLAGVYTVSTHNTAVLRWLRLGKTYGDKVEVLAGLTPDEMYIVSANAKLYNGAPVTIQ